MMLRLDFEEFQKKITQNSPVFPTIHYCEYDEQIKLVFLSGEGWKYYTIVEYSKLREFAGTQSMSFEEALDMFKINYLSNAVRLEPQSEKDWFMKEEEPIKEEYLLEQSHSKDRSTKENSMPSPLRNSLDIPSGDDIVKEATGYSDFLLKLFNSFEKRVLSGADNIYVSKSMEKSFGDFLKNMFNTVNTVAFGNHIKRYIRMDLLAGLEMAENELNVDIGYTQRYNDKLAQLTNQQLSGYTINGKKWFGIKGITKELQADLIQIVQEGINANKSVNEIKEDIKGKFDKFSDWRSEMIARTETTRIINEGKILGYKETGLEGKKVWITAPYEPTRSSEICQRLKGQEVDLDDDFIDPETMKSFSSPPAHPNCRSTIAFKPI